MQLSMSEKCKYGLYVGAGIALAPAAATLIIASSRALLVNIIANGILSVLTGGAVGIKIQGLSLIEVPLLWKISKISAMVGGSIVALSLLVYLVNSVYQRVIAKR